MSTELILGVATIGASIGFAVWQLLRGELRRKYLVPKIEFTYFTLKALVAAQKSSPTANAGLTYDRSLFRLLKTVISTRRVEISIRVGRTNCSTPTLKDSIKSLSSPESKTLEPLIEKLDSDYIVTTLGINIFDKLPPARSECARKLDEYLKGSLDVHSGRSDGVADKATTARARRRPTTHEEWRHDVFMLMPEDEAFELNDLQQLISQKLPLSSLRGSTHKKVGQAIKWNLDNGNLLLEVDGRIRLAVPKTSKTLDNFK